MLLDERKSCDTGFFAVAYTHVCLLAGSFETRGDYLYTYLGTAGITETTCKQFAELLDEAATTLLAKQVGAEIRPEWAGNIAQ